MCPPLQLCLNLAQLSKFKKHVFVSRCILLRVVYFVVYLLNTLEWRFSDWEIESSYVTAVRGEEHTLLPHVTYDWVCHWLVGRIILNLMNYKVVNGEKREKKASFSFPFVCNVAICACKWSAIYYKAQSHHQKELISPKENSCLNQSFVVFLL